MKYIILGIVQGLTEFLPVSSSGHLVITEKLLGIDNFSLILIVTAHLGTVLALILFFFKDIIKVLTEPRLLRYILLVTLITAILGILGKDFFLSLFSSIKAISIALIFTGLVLIFTRGFLKGKRDINSLNLKDASVLGFTQAISIIPGISRSGFTISSLLFRGVDRETAFRFSFLSGIPAVLAAFLSEAKYISLNSLSEFMNLFLCFIFSFLSGLFALWILNKILRKAKFHYFGYYCILIAVLSFIFFK